MPFRYQAIDAQGRTVTDVIDAPSLREAGDLLRERRLFVTRLVATDEAVSQTSGGTTTEVKAGGKLKDIVFFTQQMSMLIRSGARVVQALNAVESQCQRPGWRKVVTEIRTDVEAGRPLSTALAKFPRQFSAVYVNMISAGEASGDLGLAFERLAHLTRQQQEIRNRVIGAMAYPALLVVLCTVVLAALFTFVLPRFAEMFETVGAELPASTRMLIDSSQWVRSHWKLALAGLAIAAGGAAWFLRSERGQRCISRFTVRVRVFGPIVRNVILARLCRIWGQLLDSKVGLLDAVQLTRDSTTNLDFRELLEAVANSIIEGQSISGPLLDSWLLPRTFSAAIVTGEESGRLADSLLFVASCLEDENAQVLASLSRVIEPILLSIMGVIVGTVAISLFLPMFDLATMAGGPE